MGVSPVLYWRWSSRCIAHIRHKVARLRHVSQTIWARVSSYQWYEASWAEVRPWHLLLAHKENIWPLHEKACITLPHATRASRDGWDTDQSEAMEPTWWNAQTKMGVRNVLSNDKDTTYFLCAQEDALVPNKYHEIVLDVWHDRLLRLPLVIC